MKYSVFIFLYFSLSACVTPIELHNKDSSSTLTMKKKWKKTIPTFFFGFVTSTKDVTAWDKCQEDKYSIKISRPFLHTTAAFLTLGIYTPLKIIITCYREKTNTTDEIDELRIFNQDSPIKEN